MYSEAVKESEDERRRSVACNQFGGLLGVNTLAKRCDRSLWGAVLLYLSGLTVGVVVSRRRIAKLEAPRMKTFSVGPWWKLFLNILNTFKRRSRSAILAPSLRALGKVFGR